MLLIPHTVQRELENIKTRTEKRAGKVSKGDLWRVQRLTGSGGLLEDLCKKCGCDILGIEQGEAHVDMSDKKKGHNDYTIISVAAHYSQLLNKENNLGFVLLTNDRAMYTIASGKGIPVASLNALNEKVQMDQVRQMEKGEEYHEWNATYLRRMFVESGFVGGFVKKHLINDAVALLAKPTPVRQKKAIATVELVESDDTKERISLSDEAPVVDENAYVFRRTDVAPEIKEEIPTSDEEKDEDVDQKIEEKIAESVN